MVSINYTLIAQIVNFIILLWVLAKFAYKPLLKAMDDRRAKIVKIWTRLTMHGKMQKR